MPYHWWDETKNASDDDDDEESQGAPLPPEGGQSPHELKLRFKLRFDVQKALCFPTSLETAASELGATRNDLVALNRDMTMPGHSHESAVFAIDISKALDTPSRARQPRAIFLHSAYFTPTPNQLVPPDTTFWFTLYQWDDASSSYIPALGSTRSNYLSDAFTEEDRAGLVLESGELRANSPLKPRVLVSSNGVLREHLRRLSPGKPQRQGQRQGQGRLLSAKRPLLLFIVEAYIPRTVRNTIINMSDVATSGHLSLRVVGEY